MERNKGLSLVELLITIAILSIVLVIAVSFMMTGSRSFTKGNADSTVQKEAELTVNQIEDMIIDINGGVFRTDDADKRELTMYHTEDDGTGTMLYTKSAVTWNKSDNNLYCSKWKVNYDASTGTYVVDTTETKNYENQLLAEHVTSFDVDLSDTLTTKALDGTTQTIVKSVLVEVGYDDGTGLVDYATSPVITLRNRMLLSDNPANIFDEPTPAADTLKLYYTGTEIGAIVPIVDRVSEVQRGFVYNIYARINTGADVGDLVNWKIEETGTLSTIDANGILTVGAYETNAYLTITAEYKSNPNKKATGVVKVVGTTPLKSLKSVHILTKSLKAYEAHYGSTVVTEGFKQSEEDAIIYQWTVKIMEAGRDISDVVENFTDITDNTKTLDLSIKKDPANYGKILEITLTAHSDITGETVSDRINYRISDEGAVGGDSFMERGKGGHHDTDFWFTNNWASEHGYEWYFCDIYGNRISEYDNLLGNVTVDDRGCTAYGLFLSNNLPLNRSYYIKVICWCKNTDWQGIVTEWQRQFIHYIPEVRMYGKMSYETTTVNSIFNFYYALDGYYEVAWQNQSDPVYEYSVEAFDYEAPAGTVVTPRFDKSGQGGTVTLGDDCTIHAWGGFTFEGDADAVVLKSLKIKVSMKDHPEIYTYSTVVFE